MDSGEVFRYADLSLGFRRTVVLVQPAEVEFYLTFVGCFERAEFQFDPNQPP